MIFNLIKNKCRRYHINHQWRKQNKKNGTYCLNEFDHKKVSVGEYSYGPITVLDFGKDNKLKIGSFCSIASGVVFNLAGDHNIDTLSTFPYKAKVLNRELNEATSKGDIVVCDDVWIGQNAIILSGVHIGQGAVVAAGAAVTKDVPPYAVVGGVPAKIIKYRFNEEIIDYMLSLDYSQLTKELIGSHIDDLYQPINEKSLDEIKKIFEWFPKNRRS